MMKKNKKKRKRRSICVFAFITSLDIYFLFSFSPLPHFSYSSSPSGLNNKTTLDSQHNHNEQTAQLSIHVEANTYRPPTVRCSDESGRETQRQHNTADCHCQSRHTNPISLRVSSPIVVHYAFIRSSKFYFFRSYLFYALFQTF